MSLLKSASKLAGKAAMYAVVNTVAYSPAAIITQTALTLTGRSMRVSMLADSRGDTAAACLGVTVKNHGSVLAAVLA